MFFSALCGSYGFISWTSGAASPVGGGIFTFVSLLELTPGVPGSGTVSTPSCQPGPSAGPSSNIGPDSSGAASAGACLGADLSEGFVFLGTVGPMVVGPESCDCARQTPTSTNIASRYFIYLF